MTMIALFAALLLALPAQSPSEEAARALHEQTRLFPPCDDASLPQLFDERMRAEAARFGIEGFTLTRIPEVEVVKAGEASSPVRLRRLEVAGSGDIFETQMLLHRIAFEREFRAVDIETLRIEAADGGTVKFSARVVDGCWDTDWNGPMGPMAAAVRQVLDRMHPMLLTDGLEAVEEDWGDLPVMLSEAGFAKGELTLRGVALGANARGSIATVLSKAGFAEPRIEWTPAGECAAFTAVTRIASTAAAEREAVPKDVFDERTSALCSAAPSPKPVMVKAKGTGPITIRARDIDVSAVFLLLNDLSPADGFIVEAGVEGRVDLDFEQVSMAEALGALRGAGIGITAGPLHRACKGACKPASRPEQKYEGTPVSFIFVAVDLVDLFRLFREITGLEIHARELKGTLSVYARDVEWDRLFDGVIAAIGRSYSIGEKGVMIDPDGVPIEKLPTSPYRRPLELAPHAISVDDLRLAAVAGGKAWARMPGSSKKLLGLEAGTAFSDGRVEAVQGGEVVLSTGRRLTF